MDNTPKIKSQEAPRDKRFNPVGQVKTVNGSVASPHTGSLALILATLSEDGTKMDCPVYNLLARKWTVAKSDARHWYHSAINWKLGQLKNTFLQSDAALMHMLCIKKDGTVDETALAACFKSVIKIAKEDKGSVHVSAALLEATPEVSSHLDAVRNAGISVFIYTGDAKKVDEPKAEAK